MTARGNFRQQVRAYVSQIEGTEAEIAELNTDKSETYKSAKEAGLDVAALRNVIAYRRKCAKHGAATVENAEEKLTEYLNLLDDGTRSATRVHAHEKPEMPTATAGIAIQDRPAPAKLLAQEPIEGSGGMQDRSSESIPPPLTDDNGHLIEDIPASLRRVA